MRYFTGLLFGFLATCIWATFYIAGRWIFGEDTQETLNPWFYNFLRFAAAVLVLLPMLFVQKNRKLVREAMTHDWKQMLLIAFVGIVLESAFVFLALKYTTAARTSLMANTSPISTVLLAAILFKEKITVRQMLGMLLGFAGIAATFCIQGEDLYSEAGTNMLKGDLLAIASGVCWAFFTVIGNRYSAKYTGPVCTFIFFSLSTLLMLPSVFLLTPEEIANHFTPRLIFGILYTGSLSLALANTLWYAALSRVKASSLGAFGYLSAMLTFLFSHFMLKEHFSFTFLFSIAVILTGIALMLKKKAAAE